MNNDNIKFEQIDYNDAIRNLSRAVTGLSSTLNHLKTAKNFAKEYTSEVNKLITNTEDMQDEINITYNNVKNIGTMFGYVAKELKEEGYSLKKLTNSIKADLDIYSAKQYEEFYTGVYQEFLRQLVLAGYNNEYGNFTATNGEEAIKQVSEFYKKISDEKSSRDYLDSTKASYLNSNPLAGFMNSLGNLISPEETEDSVSVKLYKYLEAFNTTEYGGQNILTIASQVQSNIKSYEESLTQAKYDQQLYDEFNVVYTESLTNVEEYQESFTNFAQSLYSTLKETNSNIGKYSSWLEQNLTVINTYYYQDQFNKWKIAKMSNSSVADTLKENNEEAYKYLSDEYKATYYWLAENGFNDAAETFLEFHEEDIVKMHAYENVQARIAKNGLDGSYNDYINLYGMGTLDGVKSFCEGVSAWVTADASLDIKDYETMFLMQELSNSEKYSKIADDVYNIAVSNGNMLIPLGTGAIVTVLGGPEAGKITSSVLMGVSAGGSSYEQALEGGADTPKALAYGITSGLSEVATEHLLGGIPGMSMLDKSLVGSMSSEFVEEFSQTYIDAFLQNNILGKDISYTSSDLLKEATTSGIYGFISGGMFSGANVVVDGIIYTATDMNFMKENNCLTNYFSALANKEIINNQNSMYDNLAKKNSELAIKYLNYTVNNSSEKGLTDNLIKLFSSKAVNSKDVINELVNSKWTTEQVTTALEKIDKVNKSKYKDAYLASKKTETIETLEDTTIDNTPIKFNENDAELIDALGNVISASKGVKDFSIFSAEDSEIIEKVSSENMSMDNIAIVRATNIIPFDGIVQSISNSQYITKTTDFDFAQKIKDVLTELNITPSIDYSQLSEDYFQEISKKTDEVVKQFIPYISDYNSMALFSLNGLVPDDSESGFGNNTFSDKKCAVIDSLSEHINDIASIVPTDTAIKGNVNLSPKSIILIEEDTFSNLTAAEKVRLDSLNLTIKTFKGNLEEAVYNELAKTNQYIPEKLSLTRKDGGFIDSSTSENQKTLINNIATEYNIPQVLFFDYLTEQNESNIDEENGSELAKSQIVEDYYLEKFYRYLLSKIGDPDDLESMIPDYMHYDDFLDDLIAQIKDFGIDKYKEIVDGYNNILEEERKSGKLLTPEEIINNEKNKTMEFFDAENADGQTLYSENADGQTLYSENASPKLDFPYIPGYDDIRTFSETLYTQGEDFDSTLRRISIGQLFNIISDETLFKKFLNFETNKNNFANFSQVEYANGIRNLFAGLEKNKYNLNLTQEQMDRGSYIINKYSIDPTKAFMNQMKDYFNSNFVKNGRFSPTIIFNDFFTKIKNLKIEERATETNNIEALNFLQGLKKIQFDCIDYYISNEIVLNKNQFQTLILTLADIKENFDIKEINYISSAILNDYYDLNEKAYKKTISSLFNLLCQNKGYKDVTFSVEALDKGTYGLFRIADSSNFKVILNEKYFDSSNFAFNLETLYHEFIHITQEKTTKIGYSRFLYEADMLIRKYEKNYYKKNYKYIDFETEAREKAAIFVLRFIEKISPVFYENYKEKLNQNIAQARLDVQVEPSLEINGEFLTRNDLIEKIIQANPSCLAENIALTALYNFDGSKKSIEKLQQNLNLAESEELKKLFIYLINEETLNSKIKEKKSLKLSLKSLFSSDVFSKEELIEGKTKEQIEVEMANMTVSEQTKYLESILAEISEKVENNKVEIDPVK